MSNKRYLGDGAYVELRGAADLVLTTSDGIRTTNTIVLEAAVWRELIRFVGNHTHTPPALGDPDAIS